MSGAFGYVDMPMADDEDEADEVLRSPCVRRVCLMQFAESGDGSFGVGEDVTFGSDFLVRTGLRTLSGRMGRVARTSWSGGAQLVQVRWIGGGLTTVLASNLARA